MAVVRVIQCQECGHHEITKSKNTKRCHVCRLLINLRFMKDRSRKCWLCGHRYLPIARDDDVCGKCAFAAWGSETVTCVYCGNTGPSVAKSLSVCNVCARSEIHRKKFKAALSNRKDLRVNSDPGEPPDPWPYARAGDTVEGGPMEDEFDPAAGPSI